MVDLPTGLVYCISYLLYISIVLCLFATHLSPETGRGMAFWERTYEEPWFCPASFLVHASGAEAVESHGWCL
jgi:hypothetical protein